MMRSGLAPGIVASGFADWGRTWLQCFGNGCSQHLRGAGGDEDIVLDAHAAKGEMRLDLLPDHAIAEFLAALWISKKSRNEIESMK